MLTYYMANDGGSILIQGPYDFQVILPLLRPQCPDFTGESFKALFAGHTSTINFSIPDMLAVLQRMQIVVTEKSGRVELQCAGGRLKVTSTGHDNPSTDSVSAGYGPELEGQTFSVLLDTLKLILSSLPGGRVWVRTGNPISDCAALTYQTEDGAVAYSAAVCGSASGEVSIFALDPPKSEEMQCA